MVWRMLRAGSIFVFWGAWIAFFVGRATHGFEGSYPIRAVATVGMVADLVTNVGGEYVAVSQIMGPGVDPHLYKATRDDVRTLMGADIVFYSGLMLEGKMSDTLSKMGRQRPVVAVTAEIEHSRLIQPEGFEGHVDPHVWMDVSMWSDCVATVAKELGKFDEKHASEYERRATEYAARLRELHEYGVRVLATVPHERRILVTSHDAFHYFGRAYGLDVQGVQGISTESESGLQRVNELVDLLVAKKVQAVFVESSVPRKSIEAIVEGARSRGHNVTIGGELFSDAMGATGAYEGSYAGMLDYNITTVARALGGEAPSSGWNGRLEVSEETKDR